MATFVLFCTGVSSISPSLPATLTFSHRSVNRCSTRSCSDANPERRREDDHCLGGEDSATEASCSNTARAASRCVHGTFGASRMRGGSATLYAMRRLVVGPQRVCEQPLQSFDRRWRRHWRKAIRFRDDAGSLGKSPRFTALTHPKSGFSVYGYGDSEDPRCPAPGGCLAH